MKILLLTCHLYQSKNKAGFHHLADALQSLNHSVHFCTCPNSLLNVFKNYRQLFLRLQAVFSSFFPQMKNNIVISSYTSILHNYGNSTYFNALKTIIFKLGYSTLLLKRFNYDIIIFESGVSLFLIHKLKKRFPNAKLLYRASDDLYATGASLNLQIFELKIISLFDLISTPNDGITNRIKDFHPNPDRVETHYHGINKFIFEEAKKSVSPFCVYPTDAYHALFVGMADLDWVFLDYAASQFPNVYFHIIGPLEKKHIQKNIIYHGLLNFEHTLPFIAHCDIGLHISQYSSKNFRKLDITSKRRFIKHAAKALKFFQYAYFNKPIIAPSAMELTSSSVFSYTNTSDINEALNNALNYNNDKPSKEVILDWKELAQLLINKLHIPL